MNVAKFSQTSAVHTKSMPHKTKETRL